MIHIFKDLISRRNLKESTSSRIFEEDEQVLLKVSHKEDEHEVTNLSYKQLFKLIKERDMIEKHNIDLKDYIDFLENSNVTLRYEMDTLKSQTSKCETCVSMKKEGKDLHETLSKFTKW